MSRTVLVPDDSHPITVGPNPGRVTVRLGGETIAETTRALVLQEASYGPVLYVPREDARMDLLARSDHTSWCPYKGEASYFSIPAGGDRSLNAIWTYEAPHEAVAQIRDHLAFYPDRVDAIEQG
jgi:uncharacterized protein (DUF427 family)